MPVSRDLERQIQRKKFSEKGLVLWRRVDLCDSCRTTSVLDLMHIV